MTTAEYLAEVAMEAAPLGFRDRQRAEVDLALVRRFDTDTPIITRACDALERANRRALRAAAGTP